MGGNHFEARTSSELFRRVIQQLPYYIPPVVLANLINLVFFVFLLFAVEVVPTLLGLLMKKKGPNLPATTPHTPLGGVSNKVVPNGAASVATITPSIGGDAISSGAGGELQDYEVIISEKKVMTAALEEFSIK